MRVFADQGLEPSQNLNQTPAGVGETIGTGLKWVLEVHRNEQRVTGAREDAAAGN